MNGPKPPTVCVMGPPGSGKTWSITTLLAAGKEVFVLLTEPNGADSIIDSAKARGADLRHLHIRTLSPAAPGWDALQAQAATVTRLGFEEIAKLKAGVDKQHAVQYSEFLRLCADFIDDTGQHWGDVTEWDDSRAFVIDSLTGINAIIMQQTVGLKPSAHQGEWGVAMNLQLSVLMKLAADCRCWFVVLAHVDKELNDVTGMSSMTIHALGRKNASPIVAMFSEVVLAKRVKDRFYWSTSELTSVDTKQRGLPLSDTIEPDFGQLVKLHEERKRNWAMAHSAIPNHAA